MIVNHRRRQTAPALPVIDTQHSRRRLSRLRSTAQRLGLDWLWMLCYCAQAPVGGPRRSRQGAAETAALAHGPRVGALARDIAAPWDCAPLPCWQSGGRRRRTAAGGQGSAQDGPRRTKGRGEHPPGPNHYSFGLPPTWAALGPRAARPRGWGGCHARMATGPAPRQPVGPGLHT